MDLSVLFFAFFSGIVGSALGPVMSFVMCGLWGIVAIVGAAASSSFNFLALFPLGPFFGPHVAFGGAVAALSYASYKGYVEDGRNIVTPLMGIGKADVLIVGGVFGVLGHVFKFFTEYFLPGKVDPIAVSILITACIAKFMFDKSHKVISSRPEKEKTIGSRFSSKLESTWVPQMRPPLMMTILSVGIGGIVSYAMSLMLRNPEIAEIAAALMFLMFAVPFILFLIGLPAPVCHHIAIGAGYGTAASGGSILWGIAGAIIFCYAAEILSRIFWSYGDTWVDPPATGVVFGSFILLGVLPAFNYYSSDLYILPSLIIGVSLIYSFNEQKKLDKYKAEKAA